MRTYPTITPARVRQLASIALQKGEHYLQHTGPSNITGYILDSLRASRDLNHDTVTDTEEILKRAFPAIRNPHGLEIDDHVMDCYELGVLRFLAWLAKHEYVIARRQQ
jgi:hypothetical protein